MPRPQGSACDIGSFEAELADADLSLTKHVHPVFAREGETIIFSVRVANHGPSRATGVVVHDELPAGLSYVSFEANQGSYDVRSGLWSVGSLPIDGAATVRITTRVQAGTAGTLLVNSAAITASDQPDPVPENNASTVALTVAELLAIYLPSVFDEYAAFPIHVGETIPTRLVRYRGEVFYATPVRLPDALPAGGTFYFSAQPQAVAECMVDDELIVRLDGKQVFVFDFSASGRPEPARVQVPRATIEQLAGETVEIVYRDRYAALISASDMWLIWVP